MNSMAPPLLRHHRLAHAARASGRSLIELMVAVLIGTIVLAGVLIATSGASGSGQRTSALGRLNESGQVALQVMAHDVRMAGYGKPVNLFEAGKITKQFSTAGIRGCDGVFSNIDASTADQLQKLICPPADSATASGSFVVTYEADNYNSIPVITPQNIGEVPSDCLGRGLLATGSSLAKGNDQSQALTQKDDTEARIWRIENRYWIEKDSNGVSVLRCVGNGGAKPFTNPGTLVQGVERMVVRYGVGIGQLNNDLSEDQLLMQKGVVAYKTAQDIDEDPNWSKEPPEVRWQRVISARICLEVAGDVGSADRISGSNYGTYINCNGTATNITDGRQRRAVTMTMNLRNKTPVPKGGIIGFGDV